MNTLIKKIVAYIALISFSFSVLPAQTYDDAARITGEAETLQNNGEYQKSYDKSQEASDSIDKTTVSLFYRLMSLRIAKAKNDASNTLLTPLYFSCARNIYKNFCNNKNTRDV